MDVEYDQMSTDQKIDWLVANMSIREIAMSLVQQEIDNDILHQRIAKLRAADIYQSALRG